MLFISRTLSRQHPFPLIGKRPAIASNVASERPATTVETLIKTNNGEGNNGKSFLFKLDDGQQGWYHLTLASGHGINSSANNGKGSVINYRFYMCPGSMIQYWPASGDFGGKPDRATSTSNDIPSSCFGASGTPLSLNTYSNTGGGSGAGAGYPSANAGVSVGGGGSGFVVSLIANCEYKYNTRANVKVRTLFGYSNYISFSFVNADQETIVMLRTTASDGESGYAWTGSVEEGGEEPTQLICYTELPVVKEGDEVTIYRLSDMEEYEATTVSSVNKDTLYQKRRTAPTDATTVQYRLYTTTGTEQGNPANTGTDSDIRYLTYNSKKYYVDEDAVASYERRPYYAWEATDTMGLYDAKGRIIWTNQTDVSNGVGRAGVWAYEKCGDNMCLSMMKYSYSTLTRRSDLDTIGSRVAIGTSTYLAQAETGSDDYVDPASFTNDTEMKTLVGDVSEVVDHYTVPGTGTYFMAMCGGGGHYNVSTIHNGGAALGSVIPRATSYTQQVGGYNYTTVNGPAETLGGSYTQDGAACIIDMNDMYIDDNRPEVITNEIFSSTTDPGGNLKLYKISDSADVTKYAQKIYFPASDQDYMVKLTLNSGTPIEFTIKKSLQTTEYFLQDVKQEDTLKIDLYGDNNSHEVELYTISTETIAFGIIVGGAPWKIREYTSAVSNLPLAFKNTQYGAILVSGGGGGAQAGFKYDKYENAVSGGAGETSVVLKSLFTPTEQQLGYVNVGAGGPASNDSNSNGGVGMQVSARAGGHGGSGGKPTFVKFQSTVTLNKNSMPAVAYVVIKSGDSTQRVVYNTYPMTNGQVVKIYAKYSSSNWGSPGEYRYTDREPIATAYSQDGKLIDQATGDEYSFATDTGIANKLTWFNYGSSVTSIFNNGTGGGGGGGCTTPYGRYATGGDGGGGGGFYRFNYSRGVVDNVPGTNSTTGGKHPSQPAAGNLIDRCFDITDWTYTTAQGGHGNSGTGYAGATGGQGFGGGGGGGGYGHNDGGTNSNGGCGGAGAAGSEYAGWGNRVTANVNSAWLHTVAYTESTNDFHGTFVGNTSNPIIKQRPSYIGNAGMGGNGGVGSLVDGEAGQDGYLYLYRFETVDTTIATGMLTEEVTDTVDCGELTGEVTDTTDCDLI